MARLVSAAPYDTPMYQGGSMTVPWRAFFNSLFQMGDVVQNVVVQQFVAEDNSTDGTANEFVQQLLDLIWQLQPTATPIASPQDITDDAVNMSAQPAQNWQAQIDELRAIIEALPDYPLIRREVVVTSDPPRDWAGEIAELRSQIAAINTPVQISPVQPAAPATSADYGEPGMIAYDSGFIYVCTAPNTWKRAALTTF